MQLPPSLRTDDLHDALDLVHCYYGLGSHGHHVGYFEGARFDTFGRGSHDEIDRFTSDDVCALALLSVSLRAPALLQVLDHQSDELSRLLAAVDPDQDLVVATDVMYDDWAGWELWETLTRIKGVGATKASKLIARKRPKLRPIYDSVVVETLGSKNLWRPLHKVLRENDCHLHHRLELIKQQAALGAETASRTSAIRIFDVVTWMTGKGYTACPRPAA